MLNEMYLLGNNEAIFINLLKRVQTSAKLTNTYRIHNSEP